MPGLRASLVSVKDQVPRGGRGHGTHKGRPQRTDAGVYRSPAGRLPPGRHARGRSPYHGGEAEHREARIGEHKGLGRRRPHTWLSHLHTLRRPVDFPGVADVRDRHQDVPPARRRGAEEVREELVHVGFQKAAFW